MADGESPVLLRRLTGTTASVTDVWFEPSGGGSAKLMVAFQPGPEATEFQADMMCGSVIFQLVADIKGRRVFEASEWHPADDPGRSSRGPSWWLSGPFQRGPRDVA